MNDQKGSFRIGWAEADITPDQPTLMAGQFHGRISQGVMDPVTSTALAIESIGPDGSPGQVVVVSCDLACISDELRDAVRAKVHDLLPEFDLLSIVIGVTHSHSAPEVRMSPYGIAEHSEEYKRRLKATIGSGSEEDKYGVWPNIEIEGIAPADYIVLAAGRIAAAVVEAWQGRQPGGIAYGLGHAVVGRNRRLTDADGTSQMYGKPGVETFRNVEGYEDHSVYTLMTYDPDGGLTGMVVNVPCPSQVREHIYKISADYWHETRVELRRRFGKKLYVLAQCAPAGDQSPHLLIGKRAEERMWQLKGLDTKENAPCAAIAQKIADAVSEIEPHVKKAIDWNPVFEHLAETVHLARRLISEEDVREALEEARPFKEEYHKKVAELRDNPEIRLDSEWYREVTKTYRRMERGERVSMRYQIQQKSRTIAVELHAFRLGEIAFATNPFELYLDYAVRIRELSKATQTFLVQKAGCNGTYLPSARSVAHKGYGSVPASTDVGPEGGEQLVQWTVSTINGMWNEEK